MYVYKVLPAAYTLQPGQFTHAQCSGSVGRCERAGQAQHQSPALPKDSFGRESVQKMKSQFYLTERVSKLFLKSHKIVNFLFTVTYLNIELTVLWAS